MENNILMAVNADQYQSLVNLVRVDYEKKMENCTEPIEAHKMIAEIQECGLYEVADSLTEIWKDRQKELINEINMNWWDRIFTLGI